MSNVNLNSKKSFSDVDLEIINRFMEFLDILIDKDADGLNEVLFEDFELIHMSGKSQSKREFIGEVLDGTLNYFKSEIIEPTILWDDENAVSLIADVELTAKVYGINGKWTLNSVASFLKKGDIWYFTRWDN